MATFNKFNSFVEAVAEKVHNLGSDVLKVMLTNSAPSAANSQKTHITEITPASGYPAGGDQATLVSSAQSAGQYKLVLNDVTYTAGAAIGPFQYAVLYNDTATNKELIGWWAYTGPVTLAIGESFVIDMDPTNGVLTIGA